MLEKILEGCENLFRKFGIKSLSMDDIARELGMSKKTIYQYVSDKNDLVKKTFNHILVCNKSKCLGIRNETMNPVEEIMKITREMSNQMKGTNPSIFYDLRKYHPEAWQLFRNFNHDFVYTQIKSNLELGQSQGYYRPEINSEIIAKLYISLIQTITNPDFYNDGEYEFNSAYQEMIYYHFHGICTTKGIEILIKND